MLRLRFYGREAIPALIDTNTATSPVAWSADNDPDWSAARTALIALLTAAVEVVMIAQLPISDIAFETAATTPDGTFDASNVSATAPPAI